MIDPDMPPINNDTEIDGVVFIIILIIVIIQILDTCNR